MALNETLEPFLNLFRFFRIIFGYIQNLFRFLNMLRTLSGTLFPESSKYGTKRVPSCTFSKSVVFGTLYYPSI